MFDKILLLVNSAENLPEFTELGVREVVLLYVVEEDIVEYADFWCFVTPKELIEEVKKAVMKELVEVASKFKVKTKCIVTKGNVAIETLKVAEAEGVSAVFLFEGAPRILDLVHLLNVPIIIIKKKKYFRLDKILCAVDLKDSERLLRYAKLGKDVILLHVMEGEEREVERRLNEISKSLGKAEIIITKGKPCKEIIRVAKEKEVTLILIGYSGKLFGTANCVIKKSKIHILISK